MSDVDHPPSDAYHALVSQINALCDGNDMSQSLDLSLAELNVRDRKRLYERIDVYACGKLERTRQDVFDGEKKVVHLHVTRVQQHKGASSSVASRPIKIDEQIVSHFRKYTRLPLPVTTATLLPYYLDMLAPFGDAQAKWLLFLEDVRTYGSVASVNGAVNNVIDRVERHLSEHPDLAAFRSGEFADERAFVRQFRETRAAELLAHKQNPGNDIYTRNNDGQRFISVDINSANFTVVRQQYPGLFRGHVTWEAFITDFLATPSPHSSSAASSSAAAAASSSSVSPPPLRPLNTLQFSKFLRERLFGNLRTNKNVHALAEYMMCRILTDEAIPANDVVMLSGDEFVVRYTPELYGRLRANYHNTTYKVSLGGGDQRKTF